MSENKRGGLGEFLYANTKRRNWEAVVQKYAECPEAHEMKLTQKEETALHLAVIDNEEDIVERLLKIICRTPHYKTTLEAKNDRNNNPLHLAAALGRVRMCHLIASAHQELVDARNKDDETPLFLAATHGHTNAFYCLCYFCRDNPTRISANCREKKNGDTVLHSALRNEHFDLAFQVIHMNNEAMNWVNGEGLTPLHVLASKPTAFKSGAHITGWRKIVYHCTFVNKLKPQSIETLSKKWKKERFQAKTTPYYFPSNYGTCFDFFTRLWDGFLKVNNLKGNESRKDKDLEKDVEGEREMFDTNNEYHDWGITIYTRKKLYMYSSELSSENFPENYNTCIDIIHMVFSTIMIILGFGSNEIKKTREKKEKHTWSVQLMEKLVEFAPSDKYVDDGRTPTGSKFQTDKADGTTVPYSMVDDEVHFSEFFEKDSQPKDWWENSKHDVPETAMLLAAKNGVIEMVRRLSERYPLAVRDIRKSDKKNAVLLAAEYRQPDVYQFLLKRKHSLESMFRAVDNEGNSALHLAAAAPTSMLWHITGAALQMQWEVKWYKFVKESVPLHFFPRYNKEGKTAHAIFEKSHVTLVKDGEEWLLATAESCSVVATLIATVAFASATTIPGGNNDQGSAILENEKGFVIYAISSLVALCLSSTSVIMFLAILTSRFSTRSFGSALPWKLVLGLSTLYFSIIAMLISFCTGHYFIITQRLQNVVIVLYTLTFTSLAFIFVLAQLPLYLDLLFALFKSVPKRRADVVLSE